MGRGRHGGGGETGVIWVVAGSEGRCRPSIGGAQFRIGVGQVVLDRARGDAKTGGYVLVAKILSGQTQALQLSAT